MSADTKLNRNVLSVVSIHDSSDDAYWRACTPEERLRAVQINREIAYGEASANGRLQRVLTLLNENGVEFKSCFSRCKPVVLDGIPVNLISLADLRCNKLAAARHKDLDDIEHLPEA